MSFSTDLASLVANQLSRFVTLNPHQLAGQVENLDFWLGQVLHALETLDGFGVRFGRMEAGQMRYVAGHGTTTVSSASHSPDPKHVTQVPWRRIKGEDVHPTGAVPPPPRRIPHHALNTARRELLDATARLLARCWNEHLLTDHQLTDIAGRLGMDPGSLHFPA